MRLVIAFFAASLAAGCVSNQKDLAPDFGKAFAANADAVIVDKKAAEGAPASDPDAVNLAVERLKTDEVKKANPGRFKAGQDTGGSQ